MKRFASLGCALFTVIAGCGGGGGGSVSGGGGNTTPTGPNVAPIVVDAGPSAAQGVVNTPYVSVTICTPGGASCQTIDHITVDTQSSGVRILSSALTLNLQQETNANNQALAECTPFADGFSWGPLKLADVTISGRTASNIPVQIIGDSTYSGNIPTDCSSRGKSENTVADFGANGIIGVSVFREDCGSACATGAAGTGNPYYICPTPATCAIGNVDPTLQSQNPVAHFATDNNGVIVQLDSIGAAGAATASGSLIFGIDTESNNALGTAKVLMVDNVGDLTTIFNNQTLTSSFIDSGSNGLFFPSTPALAACQTQTGFYCPSTVQSLNATLQSAANASITTNVLFSVANADTLIKNQPTFRAFNDLGGTNLLPDSFDWGVPFFYGRKVYVTIEGQTTSGGTGPYVAF